MKYFLTCIFSLWLGTLTHAQNSAISLPKLSASTIQYLYKMGKNQVDRHGVIPQYVYYQDDRQELYVNAFLRVSPDFDEKVLQELGVKIGTRAGTIRTARIPFRNMEKLTQVRGIEWIDMDQPTAPDLDSARRRTRVDSIHKGLGLPQAFSGKNVVVGIVDAGFDYTHPTFFDTSNTRFRIKRVWEEKNTSGSPPSTFSYGTEFADSASILSRGHDITTGTHGTHVAGIAGGSGRGSSGNKFRGMAYGSDLVMVAIYPTAAYWLNTGMADMLDGINYTFQYGQSVGKPAVANLSWGCPLGPRDGNSLFSQGLDNLTGPGKIFVLSGGNNGQNKIHTSKTFTPTDSLFHTFLTFSTSLPEKKNQVDIWGDTAKSFCIKFRLYTGNVVKDSSQYFCLDGNTHEIFLKGANGDTCFVTLTAVSSEFNGKPHMLIQVLSRVNERLCFSLKGNEGMINLWQGIVVETSGYYGTFTKYGAAYPWATEGDVNSTCGDLVSTRSAIAVAAYNSKVNFVNVAGSNLSYTGYTRGQLALFSSVGPTEDGRIKPNVAGPGMALASSVSSVDPSYQTGGADYSSVVAKFTQGSTTYSYAMAAGTSMSSPAVSGITALLLEANPDLTPQQVLQLYAETAIKDNFTGAIPAGGTNKWGVGKVNAVGALKRLLDPTGIKQPSNADHLLVFPNPGSGRFSIEYLAPSPLNLTLSIMNSLGQLVESMVWNMNQGSNFKTVDLNEQPSGVFYIRLHGPKEQQLIRVVKE